MSFERYFNFAVDIISHRLRTCGIEWDAPAHHPSCTDSVSTEVSDAIKRCLTFFRLDLCVPLNLNYLAFPELMDLIRRMFLEGFDACSQSSTSVCGTLFLITYRACEMAVGLTYGLYKYEAFYAIASVLAITFHEFERSLQPIGGWDAFRLHCDFMLDTYVVLGGGLDKLDLQLVAEIFRQEILVSPELKNM